jgi:hypothetical protein
MDDSDLEMYDEHVEDCADYFATVLTDDFPGIELEPLTNVKEWRKGWRIKVAPQAGVSVRPVELRAREIRELLWWQHGVLVPYVIERPED